MARLSILPILGGEGKANSFDRTEATDILKTKDGPRDRTQIRTHFGRVASRRAIPASEPRDRLRSGSLQPVASRRAIPASEPQRDDGRHLEWGGKANDFGRTEATDLLKTKDGAPGPNPIRTHFHQSAVGSWQSHGRAGFVELLTADRQLLTDFEGTEATDLLKTKDGTRDRTQYEPILEGSQGGDIR